MRNLKEIREDAEFYKTVTILKLGWPTKAEQYKMWENEVFKMMKENKSKAGRIRLLGSKAKLIISILFGRPIYYNKLRYDE